MKTLSLAHPTIMMLAGLPGSGRSTFATAFADMFGAPNISTDRLRAELFTTPQFNDTEDAILARVAEYLMQEVAKNRRSFLVDGLCASRQDRLKIEQFAKNNGYKTLVIWVQTNPETAKSRALGRTRKKTEGFLPMPADAFERQAKKFTQPKTEDYVVISGMHSFNTQVRMVLRKLAGARPAEPPKPRPTAPPTRGIIIR